MASANGIRSAARRRVRGILRGGMAWAVEKVNTTESVDRADPTDLRSMFIWLRDRPHSGGRTWRARYVWPILAAAQTARALEYERISVLELGVAGGGGLIAMEAAAGDVGSLLGVDIAVYGFDTGRGVPRPADNRDAPFMHDEGDWPMDVEKLRARLSRGELLLGGISETANEFLRSEPPPIGFIAFDFGSYTSTRDAFALLEPNPERLLPRVHCHFGSVGAPPWSLATGEAAAIEEFNANHERRRIAGTRNLRYMLPRSEFRAPWPDQIWIAEILDHDRYADPVAIHIPDLTLRD